MEVFDHQPKTTENSRTKRIHWKLVSLDVAKGIQWPSADVQILDFVEQLLMYVDCLQSLRGDQASTENRNICPLTECSCNPPCLETAYFTTASIAKFPAENYFVATDNTRGVSPQLCRDWYANNALLLQVFFETLKYESYTEVPSYGISAVLNDLGGHAGLWLGLSVISVVEVCGLILLLLMYCLSCGKLKTRPDEEDMESDERIKDVEEVKKELDYADKHDKDKYGDEIDDDEEADEAPHREEHAKEK
ncbi:hypothetical protein NECAME_01584 [Necator americanus]|uniref:Amiloride-sensitive sodium channel n=1 Tax=Necator americanus TaxID=51031 RepID=W2TRS3_NECAM|nr:hypothetical protein NECAME_01584 [Necator americanus]ETN84364.1 hypothetical protein NECAME_01584 [Necator americanus]